MEQETQQTTEQTLKDNPSEDKTPENKVQGCVSQVFITAELADDAVHFKGDSDAQITKGLLAMLINALNGLSPAEVVQLTPDFIKETQLDVSLTPSRANGFYNIFKLMQKKALLLMGREMDSSEAVSQKV
ncbi:MAG: SufE family protein [Cyanobacteria bacterium J06621_11]